MTAPRPSTSVGLGDGEVVIVNAPFQVVRAALERGLRDGKMIEVKAVDGTSLCLNPMAVKVLQPS